MKAVTLIALGAALLVAAAALGPAALAGDRPKTGDERQALLLARARSGQQQPVLSDRDSRRCGVAHGAARILC